MYLYESSDELFHYGVLGMKWGRRKQQSSGGNARMSFHKRRLAKKELKENYKQAKKKAGEDKILADARSNKTYSDAASKAKAKYDEETAPAAAKRDKALADNDVAYNALKKQTKSYYESEINSHMKKAEKYDADANFWGRESTFGKESVAKSDKHLNEAAKAESRYNEVKSKNKTDNESRVISIKAQYDVDTKAAADRYSSALSAASSKKYSEYAANGEAYFNALKNAKVSYELGKKALKSRK